MPKKETIYPAYVSKDESNRGEQVIIVMNSVINSVMNCSKKPSALLRRITSKYHSDFYCLNCFHSFASEKKSRKKMYENKDFGCVVMFSK